MSKYQIAETFKSIQGEGVHTGVPMAFIRFVGCSVGKRICQHCDTDFDKTYPWLGGGEYSSEGIRALVGQYQHVCLTGGEPLDQPELAYLVTELNMDGKTVHIETSGTVNLPIWATAYGNPWITCCPKPGYKEEVVALADEVKVIVGGLGNGPGWPTLDHALAWADFKPVYLQPRNDKYSINAGNLALAEELVRQHPTLRLSVQMHKLLKVR